MPREQQLSVLIASSNEKFDKVLMSLLPANEYGPVECASSVGAARRRLDNISFDLLIVNAPLKDEQGSEFAIDIARETGIGVMLLLDAPLYDEISSRAEEFGVLTLSKPTSRAVVTQTLKLLVATRQRLKRLEQKAQSFEEKIAEIKIVNRAKLLLMEREGIDEDTAHRFIEKSAMDLRRTRRVIAEDIISRYKE
ncbi:MAG: ANTAR domain-containing protein [Clostridiales bacterium]|nr:ANTAR domain-containing protein [Clostridiales bacterium]